MILVQWKLISTAPTEASSELNYSAVLAQNSHPELGFWKSIVLFFSLWVTMFIGSENSQSGSIHQRFLYDWEMKNHRSPTLWQSVKTTRILITKHKAKHRRKDSEELGRNSVLVSPENWWALKGGDCPWEEIVGAKTRVKGSHDVTIRDGSSPHWNTWLQLELLKRMWTVIVSCLANRGDNQ